MIDVATWQVSQINQAQQSATLKVSPEYQRRPVWTKKDQMLLIDSIARGVPVGAITLYVDSATWLRGLRGDRREAADNRADGVLEQRDRDQDIADRERGAR